MNHFVPFIGVGMGMDMKGFQGTKKIFPRSAEFMPIFYYCGMHMV